MTPKSVVITFLAAVGALVVGWFGGGMLRGLADPAYESAVAVIDAPPGLATPTPTPTPTLAPTPTVEETDEPTPTPVETEAPTPTPQPTPFPTFPPAETDPPTPDG